ncbi:MAG TPA: PH domain-containing protein [Kineosporiaceae bacterium]|nr:PH domain-containing protein [Kineosporiaceae bacterium]
MPAPHPTAAEAPAPAAADGEWHRVHPLTPAVQSWQALVVVLVVAVQDVGQGALRDAARGGFEGRPDASWLRAGLPVVLGVAAVVVGLLVLSWRLTRYRVTAEALELRHGVLVRRQRRARLDRLQAVDLVQPLVARIFGLARLKLEVAGGTGSSIELSYLTDTQARRLRNHLLAAAAGLEYETPHAPEAPERPVAEVPVPRLIASIALDPAVIVGVLVGGTAITAGLVAAGPAAAAGVLPIAVGVVTFVWRRFAAAFGFTVTASPDGLRLRHGLLEHRAQTVPPGRVQAVRVSQPLLWRGPDWWRVVVNVAGYAGRGDNRSTENELLPVGTREQAVALLALVLPDLGVEPGEDALAVVTAGLDGDNRRPDGYLPAPRRAFWVDPVGWRRIGVHVTHEALLVRRGRLHRRLDVVPHARTQSCAVTQGPVQRALGVASLQVHSTRGPVDPVVPHLLAQDAARLLDDQAVRARRARRLAVPDRWLEARPTAPPGA